MFQCPAPNTFFIENRENTRNTSGLWHQTQWNADRRMPINFNPLTKAVWTRTRICETRKVFLTLLPMYDSCSVVVIWFVDVWSLDDLMPEVFRLLLDVSQQTGWEMERRGKVGNDMILLVVKHWAVWSEPSEGPILKPVPIVPQVSPLRKGIPKNLPTWSAAKNIHLFLEVLIPQLGIIISLWHGM